MTSIEVSGTLRNHPKTRWLSERLGVPRNEAIGLLIRLWWFAADRARDGDLSRYSAERIADAVDWSGPPDALIAALQGVGFLDGMKLHDWDYYRGKPASKRETNAERQRRFRERRKDENIAERGSNEKRYGNAECNEDRNEKRYSNASNALRNASPSHIIRNAPASVRDDVTSLTSFSSVVDVLVERDVSQGDNESDGLRAMRAAREADSPEPKEPPKRAKRSQRTIPTATFRPNEDHARIAEGRGLDLDAEREKWLDYCAAKGAAYVDHDAAFRNWLKSPYAKPTNGHHGSTHPATKGLVW